MTVRLTYKDFPNEIYSSLLHVEGTVRDSGLDKRLLAFIKIRASIINGCAFCIDMHCKEALKLGLTTQEIYGLNTWAEAPYYTDQEKAVLNWVDTLTRLADQQVPDSAYEQLASFFDKATIGKLILAVIAINSWNRMILAIGTEAGTYQVA